MGLIAEVTCDACGGERQLIPQGRIDHDAAEKLATVHYPPGWWSITEGPHAGLYCPKHTMVQTPVDREPGR